jgi:hypothetical protein
MREQNNADTLHVNFTTACASCGYPAAKIRSYNWSVKAKRRKTTGTGRMSYLKVSLLQHLERRAMALLASDGRSGEASGVAKLSRHTKRVLRYTGVRDGYAQHYERQLLKDQGGRASGKLAIRDNVRLG